MRRLILGLFVVVFCGCGLFENTSRKVVARVGDHVLRTEQFANAVTGASLPMSPELVERWAWRWVQYSLFAQRLTAGDSFADSATVVEAVWPEVLTARYLRLHERLVAERLDLGPAAMDSAYAAGDHRLVDHILIGAGAGTTPSQKEAQRQRAEAIHGRLVAGASWAVEAQASDDRGTAQSEGRLGVLVRGQAVPEFEQAVFDLEPGGISEVIETPYGFHVIRRPALDEVREEFSAAVSEEMMTRFVDGYLAELSERNNVRVRNDAAEIMRDAADRPIRILVLEPGRIIGEHDGGSFTDMGFVRWLQLLPRREYAGIQDATDEKLEEMAREAMSDDLLAREMDLQSIEIRPEEMASFRVLLARDLRNLRNTLGLDSLMAGAEGQEDRMQRARDLVDRYLERTISTRRNIVSVPPALAAKLRADGHWKFYYGGLNRAIERAVELRAARDSTTS